MEIFRFNLKNEESAVMATDTGANCCKFFARPKPVRQNFNRFPPVLFITETTEIMKKQMYRTMKDPTQPPSAYSAPSAVNPFFSTKPESL